MSAIPYLNRRSLLAGLAASPIALTGIGAFPSAARAQAQGAGLISPNVCLVTPAMTEGPYYFDPDLVRADVTEDREGMPLRLQIQVVSADCVAIPNARVDIWHCDARGIYSGYRNRGTGNDARGETFLRGTQMTNANGTTTFQTIYPGWYPGRTTHIHYKVFLDQRTVLTSQLFFPDTVSEALFDSTAPYNERAGQRDTMNSSDGILRRAGDGAYAAVQQYPEYYDAALVVGINA
ncbi:intradiol ring-cleavage dioxygenase [Tropicibacter naphthalenivorans]|uniref:Catechol 1,2-dioxygenase n=1 Tax=Tropicibacter naphthalenivorans TaxID=441103 RepID=A0A0N7LZL7_9RHOB|nr:intradiol ring-cleavage dioxygenase [Tropicibacter naphthalenivorans]CUH78017.1 Catechol 1,2-dioxygenase [Tropicibacter naphthalenivorans]SMC94204.1 Dioxygenase [Tropicibacter naphthalenivorans]